MQTSAFVAAVCALASVAAATALLRGDSRGSVRRAPRDTGGESTALATGTRVVRRSSCGA
jgi:hypothetical protein